MIVDVKTTKVMHFDDFLTGDTFVDEDDEIYIKGVWKNTPVAVHLETGEILSSSVFNGILTPIILKVVNA